MHGQDLSEEELEEMWDQLPKKNVGCPLWEISENMKWAGASVGTGSKGDFIDVLAFRDLLAKDLGWWKSGLRAYLQSLAG